MFRMPSVEAHATQGNCYCYCRWYCCSYMMCWAAQLAPDWGAPSCYFLSQPTSVVLGVGGGTGPVPYIGQGSQKPRHRISGEAGTDGLWTACWGISVSYSMGPQGVCKHNGSMCEVCNAVIGKASRPPAQEGQLEGTHFKGQAAGVMSGDLEFYSWLCPHELRADSYLSLFPKTGLEMDHNQKHKYKWII